MTPETLQKLAEALRQIAKQLEQIAAFLSPQPYDPDQGK
jgi:hypothetical protein